MQMFLSCQMALGVIPRCNPWGKRRVDQRHLLVLRMCFWGALGQSAQAELGTLILYSSQESAKYSIFDQGFDFLAPPLLSGGIGSRQQKQRLRAPRRRFKGEDLSD